MQTIAAKSLLPALLAISGAAAVTAVGFRHASDVPAPPTAQPDAQTNPYLRAPAVAKSGAHSFYFTRAVYSGFYRGSRSWSVDYPEADRWFAGVLGRLTGIDVYANENPVALDDPELRRFPFLYALEVGDMDLRESEVEGLRNYLLAGGFLMIDDFWGTRQWYDFERQIRRVLPEYDIVNIPLDHPIYSTFYNVDEIIQVPNITNGRRGGPTYERDGYEPYCLGIFDDDGRLMVVINWNTDLGDAWEWAEDPYYPLHFSTFAYQMGANFIVYAMTH